MGCCAGTENKITTNPKAFEKETIAPAVIPPAQPKPQPPKPTRKSSSDSDKKIEVIKE